MNRKPALYILPTLVALFSLSFCSTAEPKKAAWKQHSFQGDCSSRNRRLRIKKITFEYPEEYIPLECLKFRRALNYLQLDQFDSKKRFQRQIIFGSYHYNASPGTGDLWKVLNNGITDRTARRLISAFPRASTLEKMGPLTPYNLDGFKAHRADYQIKVTNGGSRDWIPGYYYLRLILLRDPNIRYNNTGHGIMFVLLFHSKSRAEVGTLVDTQKIQRILKSVAFDSPSRDARELFQPKKSDSKR